MKTKIIYVLLALAALIGCDKTEGPIIGAWHRTNNHFFNFVFVPSKMVVQRSIFSDNRFWLDLTGNSHDTTSTVLSEFHQRIGDEYKPKYYITSSASPVVGVGSTLIQGVKSLEVISITHYSDAYPAGSSLAPIVEIDYSSYDKIFRKTKPIIDEDGTEFQIINADSHTIRLSGGLKPMQFPFVNIVREGRECNLFQIRLRESSTQPRGRIRFVLTLEDDTTLEYTDQFEFN